MATNTHLFPTPSAIPRHQRERLNGHRALVLWFTGLSGSGKSTLARAVEQQLFGRGIRTCLLDGDTVRTGLNQDLGFSEDHRRENIRRIGEVAALAFDAGLVVIAACISPHREERAKVKTRIGPTHVVEIFVNCPLEVCQQRDAKSLYRRARDGTITDFTGVTAPFEAPDRADVEVRTDQSGIDACVEKILAAVLPRLSLS